VHPRAHVGDRPDECVVDGVHSIKLQHHAMRAVRQDHTPESLGERAAIPVCRLAILLKPKE
jgi:hypothetical protein